MNKTIAGVALALVSVLIIGGVVYATNRPSDTVSESNMSEMDHSDSDDMHDNSDGHHDDDNDTMMQTNEVTIKDFDFQPAKIQVKVGTTVTWTNEDTARHDIAPVNESADFMGSELLGKGESYSFTFEKVGTYEYICSPHPYMEAVVEVVE